ncbi:hypothetical protein [Ensifer aridi]|uniref:hypothetical protein n=1 Tax=Ensifer aridi TaxID=1708715 RepID=UPI000A0F4ED2|nr:hypothetical protein [Ensifer aridi]
MLDKTTDPLIPPLPWWPIGVDARLPLLSAGRLQAAILQTLLRQQIEISAFMQRRANQHLQLWEDVLASDYARDGFDLYCRFWRDTFLDYSEEADRLARIATLLAARTASSVCKEQEILTDEVATQMVM